MHTRVTRGLLVAGLLLAAAVAVVVAQTQVIYWNGIPMRLPATAGAVGEFLGVADTTGDAVTLEWSTPQTPEGLWSGSAVWSTTACPAGWTELAAAANRVIRVSTTAGQTGGSDTHTHDVTGVTGSQGVSISGSTASASVAHTHGYSGATSTSSGNQMSVQTMTTSSASGSGVPIDAMPGDYHAAVIGHDHTYSGTTTGASSTAHTHGAGTLAGGSHGHSDGSLATASASTVQAYYTLRLCVKD